VDVAITELEKIDAERIDGVGMPANGIPILMLKQLAAPVAKGARDCPKCSKNYDADHTGSRCENCGTDLPDAPAAKAADGVDCPTCKGDGKVMGDKRDCPDCDASGKVSPDKAKQLAAKALLADEYEDRLAWVAKGGRNYSAGERKQMADDGRALPDGSYPVNDEHDLHSAAILQRSGHGDVKAAAKHIGKRARELGVANPLDGDTAKGQIAKEGATVDTETQTGDLTEVVKAAVTEAAAPLLKRVDDLESSNKALAAELAKVKATPVPGGPVMSAAGQAKPPGDDHAVKALRYERQAAELADPREADLYRQLAAQERAKITA
jgi:DnaJ-class molecular chaperone